ncbi:MAG: heparinase II/III family protein [Candidatus Krumholzibacteriia bacterium]
MKPPGASPRRYVETLRHLHAEQVRHQLGRRVRSLLPAPRPVRPPRPLPVSSGWGPLAVRWRPPVDARVLDGQFTWWNQVRRIDLSRPWEIPELGRSWNYQVHYFDYLLPIADQASDVAPASSEGATRQLCGLVDRWIDVHPHGRGVAWEPYPTAIRIVNWLDLAHTLGERADPQWRRRVLHSVYVQAAWLRRHLERHLLGTHLLKDVKALLLASTVFEDPRSRQWRAEAEALLRREVRVQIRADGGHIEPSIMYHCTALEDVLDLLGFDGAVTGGMRVELEAAAGKMLRFARGVEVPSGGFPLLGDAWVSGAPAPADLCEYAGRLNLDVPASEAGLRFFEDAGIAVWRGSRSCLVADVGGIGPPHLSGHGHCDSLSFEWFVGGVALVVDSGTFTYEPGPLRHACRSTRAHNTLEIDGVEQHEIWAQFRVARRSDVRARRVGACAVEAELVPWHDKRLRVRRRFDFDTERIRIRDRVEGPGRHRVVSRLHLHPDCEASLEGGVLRLERGTARAEIVVADALGFELLRPDVSGSHHAQRAGALRPNAVLQATFEGELPFDAVLDLRSLAGRGTLRTTRRPEID